MRKFIKILGRALLLAFVVIQFFPPDKNQSAQASPDALSGAYPVPEEVGNILEKSCYDCHSNNTIYPWYTNIQPVGWWMQGHVDEGKKDLNFDAFATYSLRRQYRKFGQIQELIEKGEMPLPSYTLIHRDAILSVSQLETLTKWAEKMEANMRVTYPPDSLKKKQ